MLRVVGIRLLVMTKLIERILIFRFTVPSLLGYQSSRFLFDCSTERITLLPSTFREYTGQPSLAQTRSHLQLLQEEPLLPHHS